MASRRAERVAVPSRERRVVPRSLPAIESLRCFYAAAHHLNFRRAAAEVGLTPTAFSERIASLERELECTLFVRTTRRVELTEQGEALMPAALRALGDVEACVDAVRGRADYMTRVVVGTRFELGISWLLPAFIALEQKRPLLEVDSYFGSGEDIVERLERGLLDCIVTSAPVAREHWHVEFLHPESYELVASPKLLAKAPFRAVTDSRSHTLFDVDETLPLARYLLSTQPGLSFRRLRTCGSGAAMLARTLAGEGVAVLPSYMVAADLKAKRLARLLPEVRLLSDSFRLIHRRGHRFAKPLHELAEFLRSRPLT